MLCICGHTKTWHNENKGHCEFVGCPCFRLRSVSDEERELHEFNNRAAQIQQLHDAPTIHDVEAWRRMRRSVGEFYDCIDFA